MRLQTLISVNILKMFVKIEKIGILLDFVRIGKRKYNFIRVLKQ